MGAGWRRAFCTSIQRDPEAAGAERQRSPSPTPRSCAKLGLFSGVGSNPSTPRVQQAQAVSSPALLCRTKSPPSDLDGPTKLLRCQMPASAARPFTPPISTTKSHRPLLFGASSGPSSPISPSRFTLLKATLGLSRNRCGICSQSAKTGQGTAVFTGECSHAFHFPCIAAHIRAAHSQGCFSCPVCSAAWRQAPLLSSVHHHFPDTAPLMQGKLGERRKQLRHLHGRSSSEEERGRRGDAIPASKVYDDDEPLLHSPSGRSGGELFNPILEAEEENGDGDTMEEDREDFQGFVVGTSPSSPPSTSTAAAPSSGHAPQGCNGARHPSLRARPRPAGGVEVDVMPVAALISTGRRHHNYVVALKVRAPPPPQRTASAPLLDPSRRAPIDLVTVLDVGGSMSGAKLQMLKRAMRLLISSLGPADRLAVVAFSSSAAKRLVPLRRMSAQGRRSARHIVDRLVVSSGLGQGSCVVEALRKATRVLEGRRERNPVATVMLLSDGRQQQRQQDQDWDKRSCHPCDANVHGPHPLPSAVTRTRFAHLEIPIHESGFGGHHQKRWDAASSEEQDDAFTKCVGGLLSVVAQDVRLQLVFPSGEISAVYACGPGGRALALGLGADGSSVRLGDLYAEEEKELLVELRVPAPTPTPTPRHHHYLGAMSMSVRCSCRDPSSQELIRCEEQTLRMPPLHGHHDPPGAERLRNLFVATRALAESRGLAELNDLATAVHLLSSARSLLQSHSSHEDSLVRVLEVELAELQWRRQQQQSSRSSSQKDQSVLTASDGGGVETLTPTSAWRAAERLARVAIMRKSLNRVSDLHGFENARF